MVDAAEVRKAILAEMDWKVLRECLRVARTEEKLTLDDLAEASGIARSTIHRIENFKKRPQHNPDLETIEAIIVKGMNRPLSSFFLQIERHGSRTGVPNDRTLPTTDQHDEDLLANAGARIVKAVVTEFERVASAQREEHKKDLHPGSAHSRSGSKRAGDK